MTTTLTLTGGSTLLSLSGGSTLSDGLMITLIAFFAGNALAIEVALRLRGRYTNGLVFGPLILGAVLVLVDIALYFLAARAVAIFGIAIGALAAFSLAFGSIILLVAQRDTAGRAQPRGPR